MLEDANQWLSEQTVEEIRHPKTGATALHVAAAKGYMKVMRSVEFILTSNVYCLLHLVSSLYLCLNSQYSKIMKQCLLFSFIGKVDASP